VQRKEAASARGDPKGKHDEEETRLRFFARGSYAHMRKTRLRFSLLGETHLSTAVICATQGMIGYSNKSHCQEPTNGYGIYTCEYMLEMITLTRWLNL